MQRSLIHQNQRHLIVHFSTFAGRHRNGKHTGFEYQIILATFHKWPWKSCGQIDNFRWFFSPHTLLTNNDTGHYIISLCAVCSVVPSSSFAIMGTQKRAKERRQQSCLSIYVIFCTIFSHLKVWSEYCIYLTEILFFF